MEASPELPVPVFDELPAELVVAVFPELPAPGCFDELPAELAIAVFAHLCAEDLATFAVVAQRFGAASAGDPRHQWCLAADAARLQLAALPEHVQAMVPRRQGESWLCLLHEAEQLQKPARFTDCGPRISLTGNDTVFHPMVRGRPSCKHTAGGPMATKLAAETTYRARTILSCEHAQTAVANEPASKYIPPVTLH